MPETPKAIEEAVFTPEDRQGVREMKAQISKEKLIAGSPPDPRQDKLFEPPATEDEGRKDAGAVLRMSGHQQSETAFAAEQSRDLTREAEMWRGFAQQCPYPDLTQLYQDAQRSAKQLAEIYAVRAATGSDSIHLLQSAVSAHCAHADILRAVMVVQREYYPALAESREMEMLLQLRSTEAELGRRFMAAESEHVQ